MRLGVFGRSANFAAEGRSSPGSTDFSDLREEAELRDAEQNARRALGLIPGRNGAQSGMGQSGMGQSGAGQPGMGQNRQRRRFARDGDVPVVVLPRSDHASDATASQSASSPPTNRLAAAESARDAERGARQRAERTLGEVQSALRNLQTQVRHAAMTQDEALETARRAVAERDALEAALAIERQARESAEQALAKVVERRERTLSRLSDSVDNPAESTAPRKARVAKAERGPEVPKRPARARGRTPEPKPVKWWIKPRA